MDYLHAIKALIDRNLWRPIIHREFQKYYGTASEASATSEELYSFFVFQKQ